METLRALGRGKIIVQRHEIPTYGEEAALAEKNFGITPRSIISGNANSPSTAGTRLAAGTLARITRSFGA